MTRLNFFPTPIWRTNYSTDLLPVITELYNLNPAGRSVSNVSGWQSDNLDIDTGFYLDFFLEKIVPDLGIIKPDIVKIPAVWANNNKLGGFNLLHDHIDNGNIVSFVHYLKLPNGTSSIHFRSDRPSLKFWNTPRAVYNELNSQDVTIDVKDGDVIFFPSWLDHYTSPNNTDLDRITIAGNVEIEYEKSVRL